MKTSTRIATAVALTLLGSGVASAGPQTAAMEMVLLEMGAPAMVLAEAAAVDAGQVASVPESPASLSAFSAEHMMSDELLQGATAREDVAAEARSEQTSSVSNSSVNGTSVTGQVGVTDNAFQNASGMTIVNANSGNNVAMNGSITVNVVMSSPQ